MTKSRVPLQVSPKFREKLKEIQKRIMKQQGIGRSLRDLTEDIANLPALNDIENKILNKKDIDMHIRFDRRIIWLKEKKQDIQIYSYSW